MSGPALAGDCIPDGADQLLGVLSPFDQVVLRAELHGLEGEMLFLEPAQDHDGHPGSRPEDPDDRLRPIRIGQTQIEEDHIVTPAREAPQRLPEGLDSADLEPPGVLLFEHLVDKAGVRGIVLDEQDPQQ